MQQSILRSTTVVCIVLALGACGRYLTEQPSNIAPEVLQAETPESQIAAVAVLPLDVLRTALEGAVPSEYSRAENGPDLCKDLGLLGKHCVGTRYQLAIARSNFSVKGSDGAVAATVDVKASGNGGFRGDGCKLLDCDAKNFEAQMRLTVHARPIIGADWCPQIEVSLAHEWIKPPRVEIVGGVWIDIGGIVQGSLDRERDEIVKAAQGAIPCGAVRDQIAQHYRTFAMPVALPVEGRTFVNFEPTGAAFSGFEVSPTELRFAASVRGRLDVGSEPIAVRALPLPQLEPLVVTDARLKAIVPVRAAYTQIRSQLQTALAGRRFEHLSDLGTTVVTVHEVDVYPNDQRLVVGVKVAADIPGNWFDTRGWAYVAATPVLTGQQLTLSDVGFAPALDHELWNEVAALLQGDIQLALQNAGRIDLTPHLNDAKDALSKALAGAEASHGVRLELRDTALDLRDLRLEQSAVAIDGAFAAFAVMTVTGTAPTP
jgi:hypothetical protein